MAEKAGLSVLNSMSSLPRLRIILKTIGAEQPKEELAEFYKLSIARKLNASKTNIHVTFNSDFSELLSLSNIKESQKKVEKNIYIQKKLELLQHHIHSYQHSHQKVAAVKVRQKNKEILKKHN